MAGKRGPRPTPSAVKNRRGTLRAKDAKSEPQPNKDKVRQPARMSKGAKSVWQALIPELKLAGLVTNVDVFALERYATALAEWRELDTFLQDNGLTHQQVLSTGKIQQQARPEVQLRKDAHAACLQIEREFGLTPSARVRLVSNLGEPPADPKSKDAERAAFMADARKPLAIAK